MHNHALGKSYRHVSGRDCSFRWIHIWLYHAFKVNNQSPKIKNIRLSLLRIHQVYTMPLLTKRLFSLSFSFSVDRGVYETHTSTDSFIRHPPSSSIISISIYLFPLDAHDHFLVLIIRTLTHFLNQGRGRVPLEPFLAHINQPIVGNYIGFHPITLH